MYNTYLMSLKEVPGRIFLDTSVVNFMLNHGDQIYDGASPQAKLKERVTLDIDSLRKIHITGQRANWQYAISPFTYKEVISTTDESIRYYLENWFFDIWDYWRSIIEENNDLPSFIEAERIRVELLASGILDPLPDLEDRILLSDAIVYRCDCFCTRDWKTILKFRDILLELPIKIVTPTEWWELIEPYASIWA